MSQNSILAPAEVAPLYPDIIPTYQSAFAKPPWDERSKCPSTDPLQRCIGGLSAVAVGAMCDTCQLRPAQPAYEAEELVERFDALAATRPTVWYVEQVGEGQVALAAMGWLADPATIAAEKYADVPDMAPWMAERLPASVLWLDEVFADSSVRPSGNLANFGAFVRGMAAALGATAAAYRTINERMIGVARRDFGERATVWSQGQDVPDRRDFVLIDLSSEETQ